MKTNSFNLADACIPDGIQKIMLQAGQAHDWRLLSNGSIIPTEFYADQPYFVTADDGALVCVVTTGTGHEGSLGQHVVSMRSMDGGATWAAPVDVESPEKPESSYAVLLKAPGGRIFCFYNFNEDNIREMETVYPGNPVTYRVDTLGHYVFKFSDDHGKSWTEKYYKVPIRETRIDRDNIRGGKVRFLWNVGKPFVLNGAAYLSIHKVGGFGDGFLESTEGWLVRSENLLTEKDPDKFRWETLPEGDTGLVTPPGGGSVAEEQSYSVLSDGSIHVVYRTIDGYPAESYSRDGGRSWSLPQYRCYADGRRMKHPRAANFTWKCENGRYLHWFHNHGGRFVENKSLDAPHVGGYEDRNPVWVSAGIEKDSPEGRVIVWSQPEILLYDDDPFIRVSYPDLFERDGEFFISETQKAVARIHRIDPDFVKRVWGEFDGAPVDESECLLSLDAGGVEVAMPELPKFVIRDMRLPTYGMVDLRQGFTISAKIVVPDACGETVLLDNIAEGGRGWKLLLTENGGLRLTMSDGQTLSCHESETGLFREGDAHALSVIVDGGPKIVSFMVDGRFCDGGEERQFGWSRFSPLLRDAEGRSKLDVACEVTALRIFGRALMTCEAITLHRSLGGKALKSPVTKHALVSAQRAGALV
jgi:hypothetical protein